MPLRRHIFNTLTVVSLLLLLGTVGLWVLCRARGFNMGFDFNTKTVMVFWDVGYYGQKFGLITSDDEPTDTWHGFVYESADPPAPEWIEHYYQHSLWQFGLSFHDQAMGHHAPELRAYGLHLPHWFLTLIFAIGPAIWLFKWNKRRKLGPNACPACGYDLTGNESGECPECGVGTEAS